MFPTKCDISGIKGIPHNETQSRGAHSGAVVQYRARARGSVWRIRRHSLVTGRRAATAVVAAVSAMECGELETVDEQSETEDDDAHSDSSTLKSAWRRRAGEEQVPAMTESTDSGLESDKNTDNNNTTSRPTSADQLTTDDDRRRRHQDWLYHRQASSSSSSSIIGGS